MPAVAALTAGLALAAWAAGPGGAGPSSGACAPRGRARILYASDPSSVAANLMPDPATADDLRRWVDMLADSGVDLYDQEVYSQGWTAYWRSPKLEYDWRSQHRRFLPLLEAGTQPLSILIDQSHRRGMVFVAGFRMNDNHGLIAGRKGRGIARSFKEHPEWVLASPDPARPEMRSDCLDFSFEPVRNSLLDAMEELVGRFDVDGIELCFRDRAYFPDGAGRERGRLMTDLVRKARALLDRQGKAKGRKLLLGARVYDTLKECGDLGLDVPAWVSERLVDYLSPQDAMYSDFNAPYAEFAALTRESSCMLYPGMLPWSSLRARNRLANPLGPAEQRALAHTMYGAGADGISLYNHAVVMWNAPFYPQMLRTFRQLRDPARVAAGERHYVFDPTWAGQTLFGEDGRAATGSLKAARLSLDRSARRPRGEYRFNLYEDLGLAWGATLLLRGFGLTEDDDLAVRLNGRLVPDAAIRRTRAIGSPEDWTHVRRARGRALKTVPELGRVDLSRQPEPSFSTRWFELDRGSLRRGENVLQVELDRGDPRAADPIVIDELEVWVEPK
ncbi:MAG: family 10 glycosylhydrolase [Elusimicrobia bacterium]|nr:family 10 glycosylhydrolase [Elusimicrobiota bacterium]